MNEEEGNTATAFCRHGMPAFPHWHRRSVLQVDEALKDRGSAVSLPYWDWTKPIASLPALFGEATCRDSRDHSTGPNPFFRSGEREGGWGRG